MQGRTTGLEFWPVSEGEEAACGAADLLEAAKRLAFSQN